ncbi:MAG: hypothetical protein KGS44_05075 [Alphaproteobacteria bacterium]|nr:hypothetical protein [Alphaproteobacteria bacterium]
MAVPRATVRGAQAHLIGNVEILAAPRANAMAHNDKTNAAPFVILPFVLLSLGVGLACTVSFGLRHKRLAQALAKASQAWRRTIDRPAMNEAHADAAG